MRNILMLSIVVMSGLALCFTPIQDKSGATVDQQQGVYIFMLSKPTQAYDYLGSVKKSISWSGKPEEMLNGVVKKVKKEYPQADGCIFTSIDMEKADAIKFK